MADKKLRVQDDLYNYVNGEWLANAVIPDDKPRVGGFSDLDEQVETLLISDFKKMESGELEVCCDNVRKAIKLFAIAKNVAKRNKDGLRPVQKRLAKIEKLQNVSSFNRNLTTLLVESYPLPFSLFVDANMTDTTKHCIYLAGPSVILPDTTYYKEGMEQQKEALLSIWSGMVANLLKMTKLSEEDQSQYIQDALAFDAIIATLVKSQEEASEYTKMYNPTKVSRVATLMKPVKFKKLLTEVFGENLPTEISVAEPRFLKGFSTLFNEENFVLYKHWAYIMQILRATSYLSEKLRDLGSVYTNALRGVTSLPTIEKQAYRIASSYYSEPIGYYYGKKYFGEEAKKDVIEMVHEIIDTYKTRISNNEMLSPETREKAIVKLNKMVVKMGYPDKVGSFYDKLIFDEEASLYEVICQLHKISTLDNFDHLTRAVDREEWVMPGHMVNACYDPFRNDITFPAAILQAPFYSIKQSRSQNLGGIGAVIGHEISHAFDNNGAKCDEYGNINNWWTKEDTKKFNAKTKAMIKQFDGIELEWGKVNGTFIVSENIADNGGMAVTLDIMGHMANPDYKEYFFNWARVWCMKARPEFLKLLLSIDVHGPAILRANITPRNFTEWYDTFKVKKTDEMYIAPTKRVIIW